jgi:energy-coupling factor transporter ATP-binding protein EcfA2
MAKTITIKNIKHIQTLQFDIPSSSGVHVLTGSNGSGKTTLMTCLLRIGWYRAFQDHFKTGNGRVDSYPGEVIYTVGPNSVSYHHAGVRWPPTPRKNSNLFIQFGFPEVRFLPATGNRLFIQEQNINPTDFRAVDTNLKTDLNALLETSKFDNLRYVQTSSTRGPGSGSQRWKRAYVIKTGNVYYSEKNFSLGEILILNTLLLIQDVEDGSMLLIDELEMALHPRVQIRLLKYLEKKAYEKSLTVILSTHSSSLIKSANKLIYLENKNGSGEINVNINCYPATVLKDVAIEEDIQPDYIFVVEDDMAQMLLKETLTHYLQLEQDRLMPIVKVIPIGGYTQVLEFADNSSNYLFNSKIGMYLFLDNDVIQSKAAIVVKGNNRDIAEQALFEQFNRLLDVTKFLPITPELGVWNWLTEETTVIQGSLNTHYSDSTFNLSDLLDATNNNFPIPAENERKSAKRKLKYLVYQLELRTNEDSKRINQFLFTLFVKHYYTPPANVAILKATLGQIFNTRGNIIGI